MSLRPETGDMVDFPTAVVRYGVTGAAHCIVDGVATLPELATDLPATVAVAAPERKTPITSTPLRQIVGTAIEIQAGDDTATAGVYEVSAPLPVRGAVVGLATFRYQTTWSATTRYWFAGTSLLPIYMGLEYGPLKTGVFLAFSSEGTGRIVAGGPVQDGSSTRLGVVTSSDLGWESLSNDDPLTVAISIDEQTGKADVWCRVGSGTPVRAIADLALSSIGTFQPSSSNLSQWRDVASAEAVLYFGHGSSQAAKISEWAVFPYAPLALSGGTSTPFHELYTRPDMPALYRVGEMGLPTEEILGRWNILPGTSFTKHYLPGRPSVPDYASLAKSSGTNALGIVRNEPQLATNGFLAEATLSGTATTLNGVDTGMGVTVEQGTAAVHLRLLEVEGIKTIGIRKATGAASEAAGYEYPLTGSEPTEIDWSYLRHVRVQYAANTSAEQILEVFVDDLKTPVITLTDPTLPSVTSEGRILVGHLDAGALRAVLNIASITYAGSFTNWDSEGVLPTGSMVGGPAPTILASGAFTLTNNSATAGYYTLDRDNLYQRGALVEFRGKLQSYRRDGAEADAANVWVGAGVTLFFGDIGTPGSLLKKLHFGFFDCGMYGRKAGLIPAAPEDVISQVGKSRTQSVTVDWTQVHDYRLVYLPYDRIEVWIDDFRSEPALVVPWADVHVEPDTIATSGAFFAIGMFNPDVTGVLEVQRLCTALSTGNEVWVAQEPTLGGTRELSSLAHGREFVMVDASDLDLGA